MIKPFYQGKLDTFCAIYAVLNALRLINGLRTLKARDILNVTLLSLGTRPAEFKAFLDQQTDYIALVDGLLEQLRKHYHLEIVRPFRKSESVSPEAFWQTCQNWMGCEAGEISKRSFIFRFMRYLDPEKPPVNKHWTTVGSMTQDVMRLFDSSHEAEAILNVRRGSFCTHAKDVDKSRLLLIQAASARFIRLAV